MLPAVADQLTPVTSFALVAAEVTPVVLFVTVAENWIVWPVLIAVVCGVTAMLIGCGPLVEEQPAIKTIRQKAKHGRKDFALT